MKAANFHYAKGGSAIGGSHAFDAQAMKNPDMDAAYAEILFDVEAAFGKARVPVHATFDGEAYGRQVAKMGTLCHIIGLRKGIRQRSTSSRAIWCMLPSGREYILPNPQNSMLAGAGKKQSAPLTTKEPDPRLPFADQRTGRMLFFVAACKNPPACKQAGGFYSGA